MGVGHFLLYVSAIQTRKQCGSASEFVERFLVNLIDVGYAPYYFEARTKSCSALLIFPVGGVIVDSAHCLQEEEFDRPTAAYLNFCPRALSTDPAHFSTQLHLVLKELVHSLVCTV